jgi:hypothetical protein
MEKGSVIGIFPIFVLKQSKNCFQEVEKLIPHVHFPEWHCKIRM